MYVCNKTERYSDKGGCNVYVLKHVKEESVYPASDGPATQV